MYFRVFLKIVIYDESHGVVSDNVHLFRISVFFKPKTSSITPVWSVFPDDYREGGGALVCAPKQLGQVKTNQKKILRTGMITVII
jgi:hypothetical protein